MKILFMILSIVSSLEGEAGILFNQAQLPTPQGLKGDVRFWESIFRDYDGSRCVIHDSKDTKIQFDVIGVPKKSGHRQRIAIRRGLIRVKKLLAKLSKNKQPNGKWERGVVRHIPRSKRHKWYYRSVQKRLRCQRGVADQFRASLRRSKRYIGLVKKEIRKLNLPLDLAFLPHLESGYNNRARSKVGARGLWQIMPKTGRGVLKVSRHRDDRVNVAKATRFALRLLKDNYKKTGSWPLAVTAYNYGINGVMRAIRKYDTHDYMKIRKKHRTKLFRFAAKNFYPSFLAVRNLATKKHRFAGL